MRRAGLVIAVSMLGVAPARAVPRAPPPVTPVPHAEFDRIIADTKQAMLGDPGRAARLAHDAETMAGAWPRGGARQLGIATAQWLEGEAALRGNDIAAADPLIRTALAAVAHEAPGSKLNADLLLTRARIAVGHGRPQQGLDDFQQAYRMFLKLGDARSEAKALQSIGSIYQDAQDYSRVIDYYKQANEAYSNDPVLELSASNNMANAYTQMGNLDKAEIEFRRALLIAQKTRSIFLIAIIQGNIADLETISGHYAAARQTIDKAIALTADVKAASWLPILLGARARLDLAEGRSAAAVADLEQAFTKSNRLINDQSYRLLHLTAYRAYEMTGDYATALSHLETFRRMDDEARTVAASTNAALLAARFDFANQNVRIAGLKTGQLQRDVALTRLKARQSTITLGTLLALATTAALFLFIYLRTVRLSRNEIVAANQRLETTNSDLAKALSAKSEFLATTSHEIRTPLNGILGMTQVMLADRAITGMQRERIALVDSAGRSMQSLVDDILDFAKMDAGMLDIESKPVDLKAVLPDLIALWRLQAVDKGIDLLLEFDGVDDPVMTDVGRFRQIIFNLLSNAIKFTVRGSVRIRAYSQSHGAAEVLSVDVRDTGVGIPATAFETIFEPFRQLDTSTTRRFGGTGLGLAISRHLARAMGGDITVASIIGEGAVFRLDLPYLRAQAEQADMTAPVSLTDPSPRVTVISTNPITRSLLRTALAPYFARCDARDAPLIDDVMTKGELDVVLLDAEPLIDQADRLDGLVAQLVGEGAALAILSPAAGARRAVWRDAGVADVIEKPVSAEALAGRLTVLIATRQTPETTGRELSVV